MKTNIMIIRLTYLASSVFSLAAASKAGKGVPEPPPPDASKASKSSPAPTYSSMSYSMSTPSPSDSKSGKGTKPIGSKSSKSKSDEYFIAPFSCPQKCISAEPYDLSSHLLEGAVNDCDASDSYQKWKVHQVGSLLKFESAAQHDHNMCLAVVHQDPDHPSNVSPDLLAWYQSLGMEMLEGYGMILYYSPFDGVEQRIAEDGEIQVKTPEMMMGYFKNEGLENITEDGWLRTGYKGELNEMGRLTITAQPYSPLQFEPTAPLMIPEFLSIEQDDVDGICNAGKLGLAHCSHPGTNWYNTGGKLLSAFCWNHDTSTAMSVDAPNDPTCTNLVAVDTSSSGDLTTSETFMILKSN